MSGGQWTYLDIAPVRIQSYLGRARDLKGQRGASAYLSHISHRDENGQLPESIRDAVAAAGVVAETNAEAGQADGLIALRLPLDADARRVAEAVMAEVRSKLPAVHLTARWATGQSYVEVYRSHFATGGAERLESYPATREFPPLVTCRQCSADPAVGRIDLHEVKNQPVCADCLARYDDPYRQSGLNQKSVPVSAENDLLNRLDRTEKGTVQHFKELAELGEQDGKHNHLATVYVDGNGLGDLFDRIATSGSANLKKDVSAAVSDITREALVIATQKILRGEEKVPVIPHVVGGDDVLVSVVADRAWEFTITYLSVFATRMAAVPGLTELPGYQPVSASAGIVIAHYKFPFRRAVKLAGGLLRAAKQKEHGRQAAVLWLDATRDGEQPPATRRAWTLDTLTGLANTLTALRTQIDPAGRAALERLVDPTRLEMSTDRLTKHVQRLGHGSILEPLIAHSGPTAVADALSLVRWWR